MRPHQPTPTPHMKGDNRRQRETRPLQSPRRRPHQPTPTPHMKGDNRRQRETRPLQSPRRRPTPSNTHPPHEGRQPETTETTGDDGRQDHFRAQEADHTNQHQGGQILSCIKNPNSKLFAEKTNSVCAALLGCEASSTTPLYFCILLLPYDRNFL